MPALTHVGNAQITTYAKCESQAFPPEGGVA